MTKRHLTLIAILVLLLGLASLACSLPLLGGRGVPTALQATYTAVQPTPKGVLATPKVVQATYTPVEDTPAPAGVTATTAKGVQATPAGQSVPLEYRGVTFAYPAGLFSQVKPQIAPMDPGDPNTGGWPGPVPESYLFEFNGYPPTGNFLTPSIQIYPIQDYGMVNPPAAKIAGDLAAELQTGNTHLEHQPFLPLWNAGQVFYAREGIKPFQNGNGVRYLTCYSQAVMPIDKECLFYTYQGLSADGQYYLTAVLPVTLPALQSDEAKTRFKNGNLDATTYDAYMTYVKDLIKNAKPQDFTPNLNVLDALMSSFNVAPNVTLKAPATPTPFACAGGMKTRLTVGGNGRVTFTDGTPLRVRTSPGKTASIVGQMNEGTDFVVLEGPQCVGKGVWWRVQKSGGDMTGWVLEGENGTYYTEPLF